tara:strand:- start:1051 stop:1491 length:441 start_codon:yes stop_codon:yes gene_type:complete
MFKKMCASAIVVCSLGIVGCGEAVSNDHVTDTIPVTKSASVKRGVSVEKQAQALAALSVISERGGDLVSRYKECRLDSAPSDFNCVDFLYAIRIATTKFNADVMKNTSQTIQTLKLLEELPDDRVKDEVVVFGGPVNVRPVKTKIE